MKLIQRCMSRHFFALFIAGKNQKQPKSHNRQMNQSATKKSYPKHVYQAMSETVGGHGNCYKFYGEQFDNILIVAKYL